MSEFNNIRSLIYQLIGALDRVEDARATDDGDTHIEIEVPPVDKPWFADLEMNEFGGVRMSYVEDYIRPQLLTHASSSVRGLGHGLPHYWIFNGMSKESNMQIDWNSAAVRPILPHWHKDKLFMGFDFYDKNSPINGLAPSKRNENTDTGMLIERHYQYDRTKTYSKQEIESKLAEFINMLTHLMPGRNTIHYGDYSPLLTN